MHKILRLIVMLVLFEIGGSCISTAHDTNMKFKPITTLDGLPTNEVRRLYQDHEGFLWITTTNGLCVYDGYHIKTYKSNMYTPYLFADNNIRCVAEDRNRHLFIGTNNGLNILYKQTGEIKKTYNKEFQNNTITTILITRNNKILIGTERGLFWYNLAKEHCTPFNMNSLKEGNLSLNVSHLYEDSRGIVWIGTFSGLYRYNIKSNEIVHYPALNTNNTAHILYEDSKHRLWVGGYSSGLTLLQNPYHVNDLQAVYYQHNSADECSLGDDHVYALTEDLNTKTLWIGTRSGLSLYSLAGSPKTTIFQNFQPGSQRSMPFNEVNALLRDRQGVLWLGTLGGGVYSVNTYKPKFGWNKLNDIRTKLTTNSVRSIIGVSPTEMWIGVGSYGFVSQNMQKHTYKMFRELPAFRHIPSLPTINTFCRTRANDIWLGTYGEGLYLYNATKDKVTYYNTDSHPWLSNNNIFAIFQDSRNNIWLGSKKGMSYVPFKGKPQSLSHYKVKNHEIGGSSFFCLAEDANRNLWAGTNNVGLIRFSDVRCKPNEMKSCLYSLENKKLNSNDVQCIFVDSKKRIWVGTNGGGLSIYDNKKDSFIPLTDILNLPCDGVYSMLEDDSGRLWMGTNGGLICLTVATELRDSYFKLYTTSSGIQDNIFLRGCAYKAPDGQLFFGGHKGYNYFYPNKIKTLADSPAVYITDIKIFNESWDALPFEERMKITRCAPQYTEMIMLNHKQNNFSIEFSALNYLNPSQIKYSYKLDGYDSNWHNTNASQRFAYYNNLDAGTYMFCVRIMAENGSWSKNIRKIKVVILPPFWATWWAYLIYFILVIIGGTVIVSLIHRRMLERNRLHLLEIENAKIEELNHAKLQFFTNITHELLTPLTIISATVDELKAEFPKPSDIYTILDFNIKRQKRLLQQILEFRKAETGNLKLRVSLGDMATFVKNEAESFEPLIRKHKIHFSVICTPKTIKGYYDLDKLDKILYNLLSNAAKYNIEGGFVQINLSYTDKQHEKILLVVKDNGRGITPERQKGLFKRFYEGDYRKYGTIGTGIGLSLVKTLVELHKGTIRVASEVGKGTAFYVTLPINKTYYTNEEIDEDVIQTQTTITDIVKAEQEEPKAEQEKSHSVLLIEDNEDLLQLMVRLIGRDYHVFQAVNGKEGLKIIEHEIIDIVVTDVMMPEMDGIEFTKHIKSQLEYCHIPVIMLTAKTTEEDRVEAYEIGADAYICKPFNLSVLHARIKNLLRGTERKAKDFKNQLVLEMKELNYTSIDEDFMQRAVDCVNHHLGDSEFDVPQFIEDMGTSKTTLYKKLKSLTGMNTSTFIRNIRLKAACSLIEKNPTIRISDLAYKIGFNDPKYFSICFKKEFGMLPSEYCERFLNKDSE